jgi:two-component system sensor histidine kinase RstB
MRLMERVLDNLVNNALRYSSQRVAVSLTLQGSRASLQVEDDGPGIAPEERERVFEPLFVLTPAAIGRPEAAASAWPSSTVSPRRWGRGSLRGQSSRRRPLLL